MKAQQIKEIIKSEQGLFLYFYMTSCPSCNSLRPKVEEMMRKDFSKMKVLFVRSDEYPDLCAELGVFSSPMLIAFFEAKEYARWGRFVSLGQIQQDLRRLYAMVFD